MNPLDRTAWSNPGRYTARVAMEPTPMRRLIVSLASILAFAALTGCGQKGPLVRATPAAQPAPTAQPAPAPNVPPPSSSPNVNTLPVPDSGSGGV
ncbi:MAG: LPS translocon maturation chaperone LptM [Rhodanobacteraceae bacterium]